MSLAPIQVVTEPHPRFIPHTGTEDLKTHACCHQKKPFAGDTVCGLGSAN